MWARSGQRCQRSGGGLLWSCKPGKQSWRVAGLALLDAPRRPFRQKFGWLCGCRTASSLSWGDTAAPHGEPEGFWGARRLAGDAAALLSQSHNQAALEVASSSVSGGGLGVFVASSDARSTEEPVYTAGTVVALYPGVFLPLVPLHARVAARGEPVMDALRLSQLWGNYGAVDESLTDVTFDEASSYWLILEVYSGVMDGFRPRERLGTQGVMSSVAVGNLINHPPAGVLPNVGWQEFRWPDELRAEAPNRLHRGLWYINPDTAEEVRMPSEAGSGSGLPLPGIAIVALRELYGGEELFMNYRLSKPHPEWYTPVPT